MKTKRYFTMLAGGMLLAAVNMVCSCSTTGDDSEAMESGAYASMGLIGESGGGSDENTQAGIVTAGEWNDLSHWDFWSGLMLKDMGTEKSSYWKFYTNNRIAMEVTDKNGHALAGVPVKLLRQTQDGLATVWENITDNHGQANCWLGLYQQETADASRLVVSVNGQTMKGHPTVCAWDSLGQATVNRYVSVAPASVKQQADIAFIVDATGSMGDEISFLKNDLRDIIGKVASAHSATKIRTAALFYRDEDDEYLTRHSDFTDQLSATAEFVKQQDAGGGGDYPEAVHTALEKTLQNLSWNENARTRLAFLILDAPAHHEDQIIQSLQQSILLFAKKGIRLVPVAASGVDKNTEFMLRFFATATGGTYVFLTNHSGVGLDHIEATVGDYEVELLNNLLIRLINYYTE